MPLIQSAKKRMVQARKKTEQNKHYKSQMLSLFKNIIKWVKEGQVEKAVSFLSETQKAIDTAAKKDIIHKHNASRKKSLIAKLIDSALKKGGNEGVVAPKKGSASKKTSEGTEKKSAPKKSEKSVAKAPAKKVAPAKKKAPSSK